MVPLIKKRNVPVFERKRTSELLDRAGIEQQFALDVRRFGAVKHQHARTRNRLLPSPVARERVRHGEVRRTDKIQRSLADMAVDVAFS